MKVHPIDALMTFIGLFVIYKILFFHLFKREGYLADYGKYQWCRCPRNPQKN